MKAEILQDLFDDVWINTRNTRSLNFTHQGYARYGCWSVRFVSSNTGASVTIDRKAAVKTDNEH